MAGPGHGEKVTRRQEQAIAALLTEPNVEAAAVKAGVSKNALRNWLATPSFRAAFRAARLAILEGTISQLVAASGQAVDVLVSALGADKPGDQIRAAVALLTFAGKGLEVTDLAAELEALRREVEELRHATTIPVGVGPRDRQAAGCGAAANGPTGGRGGNGDPAGGAGGPGRT